MTDRVTRMSPADFKLPIIEEAYRLRRSALARSSTSDLDERTAIWIVREEAWRELVSARDYFQYVEVRPKGGNRLLGLPVRRTIHDDDDTPMIQLVMEPMIVARR